MLPPKQRAANWYFLENNRVVKRGWNAIAGGQGPAGVSLGSFLVAYDNANWDWRAFDLDRDLKVVDEKVGTIVNAVNPDLSAFKARGGKLILYHGWNDTAISPENTINYYSSVLSKMGAKQDNWMRLFMIPGMGHCQGGPGPSQVNYMGGAGALARVRCCARSDAGIPRDKQSGRHGTASLSLSAGSAIQRCGQYQ